MHGAMYMYMCAKYCSYVHVYMCVSATDEECVCTCTCFSSLISIHVLCSSTQDVGNVITGSVL